MEESQTVANAIYFGLGSVLVMAILWWLSDTLPDGSMSRFTWLRGAVMSRYSIRGDQADDDQADDDQAESSAERNDETPENSAVMPKDDGNEKFQFPDGFMALARLIEAGKLTESDALRLGIKAPAGGSTRYKEARRRLTEALNELQPSKYMPLSQEQIDNRQHLQLPIKK